MTDGPQTKMSTKEVTLQYLRRLFVITSVGACALFLLCILMSLLFMLDPGAHQDNLVGGYCVRAGDSINDAAVYRTDAGQVVPPRVFAYGWNADFIIAKRHWVGQNVDIATACWYLIQVHTAKVHGPLTEPEFMELRRELKVPDELTFTKTIQPD